VKQRVAQGQVDDRVFGKHPPDLGLEIGPLIGSPEIVDHQESAGQQVPPQGGGLSVGFGLFSRF